MRAVTVALACALLAGCAPGGSASGKRAEFVCYTRGELTERHVGVARVNIDDSGGSALWRIRYTDGPTAYYLQRHGESCGLEVYP